MTMRRFTSFVAVILVLAGCSPSGGGGASSRKQTNVSGAGGSDADRLAGDQVPANEKLVDEFIGLVADIKTQERSIEREQDRRGKLQLELLGLGGSSNCMADAPIEKLELVIDGERMTSLNVAKLYEEFEGLNEFTDDMEMNFTFTVGSNAKKLQLVNNERQTPMFVPGLRRVIPIGEQGLTLNDLQFIRIEKPAHYHLVVDVCQGQPEELCRQSSGAIKKIEEKERYLLKRLRLRVNDQLAYERDGIDFGFLKNARQSEGVKNKGLMWEESDIKLNDAFVQLMQVDQCAQ